MAHADSILEVGSDGTVSTLWTAEPDASDVSVGDDGTVSASFELGSGGLTDVGIADDGTVYFLAGGEIGKLAPGADEPAAVPIELGSNDDLEEIAVDGAGNLYLLVESGFTSKVLVRRAGTDGLETLPFENLGWFGSMAVSHGGDLYVASSPDEGDTVSRLVAGGTTSQSVPQRNDATLGPIAVDPDGNLWTIDLARREASPRITAVRLDDALQEAASLPLFVTQNRRHDLVVTDDAVFVADDNRLFVLDKDDATTQTDDGRQVAVPVALQSTAAGVAFADDSVVVADMGYANGVYAGGAFSGPDPGRLVTASEETAITLDGTAPVAIASVGGDVVVAEVTYGEDGGRVSRFPGGTGAPEVLPFQFGSDGSDDGNPYAITANAAGDIAVCASGTWGDSVHVLKNGAATSTVTQQQECEDGIAYNSAGDLYELNERVLAKLPSGASDLVDVWMPGAIDPVALAVGPDDKIYIADNGDDTTGPRVLVFADGDTDAEVIEFAATSSGHRTISVAPDGDIYVTDDSLVWQVARA